jgi:Peptidase inhibitor I9
MLMFDIYIYFFLYSEEQERVSLTRTYHHAFVGFSALLTEKEAALLSGMFVIYLAYGLLFWYN